MTIKSEKAKFASNRGGNLSRGLSEHHTPNDNSFEKEQKKLDEESREIEKTLPGY